MSLRAARERIARAGPVADRHFWQTVIELLIWKNEAQKFKGQSADSGFVYIGAKTMSILDAFIENPILYSYWAATRGKKNLTFS